jgi:hypothetical protein
MAAAVLPAHSEKRGTQMDLTPSLLEASGVQGQASRQLHLHTHVVGIFW